MEEQTLLELLDVTSIENWPTEETEITLSSSSITLVCLTSIESETLQPFGSVETGNLHSLCCLQYPRAKDVFPYITFFENREEEILQPNSRVVLDTERITVPFRYWIGGWYWQFAVNADSTSSRRGEVPLYVKINDIAYKAPTFTFTATKNHGVMLGSINIEGQKATIVPKMKGFYMESLDPRAILAEIGEQQACFGKID